MRFAVQKVHSEECRFPAFSYATILGLHFLGHHSRTTRSGPHFMDHCTSWTTLNGLFYGPLCLQWTIPGPLPGSTIFLHLSVSGPPYPDHPTRTILFWPPSLDYPAFWTTIREPLPESTTRSGPHYLDLYSLTFSRMDRIFCTTALAVMFHGPSLPANATRCPRLARYPLDRGDLSDCFCFQIRSQ